MIELRRVHNDAAVPLSEILSSTGRLPNGWVENTDALGVDVDLELVKQLAQNAASFLPIERMDAWLAPRLHASLRIPRRLAADDGIWAWLAFHCRPFVEARFGKNGMSLHPWRYRGSWSRNAIARLWWGAEMTRNGPDYSAVTHCFARTRTAQFALELMYSWDRAAAIAFSKVSEGADGHARLTDSETNGLSTKLKVLLAMRSLDSFGSPIVEDTEEFDAEWAMLSPTIESLIQADIRHIVGPASGRVSEERVKEIGEWYRQILRDYPGVRELPSLQEPP